MEHQQSNSKSAAEEHLSIARALLCDGGPTEGPLAAAASRALGGGPCNVISVDVCAAASGGELTGFLGDHFRVKLRVALPGETEHTLHLFVKTSSLLNQDKASLIDQGNFFRRERLLFSLFDELGGGGVDEASWHVSSLYHDDHLLVMVDAAHSGYRQCGATPMDAAHLLLAASTLAHYHAAYADYETRRSTTTRYNITSEHTEILHEHSFKDCPWLRAAARLAADMLYTFSTRYKHVPRLHDTLTSLFIQACDTCKEYPQTLNVLIHKDTWPNNILFCYADDTPIHALLLDYQCVRYAPPAFDIMIFVYLNTTAETRDEDQIIERYYQQFNKHISEKTRSWLTEVGYSLTSVRQWCERARMFAMVLALTILPYTLMDGITARIFDEPESYQRLCNEDRSPLVLEYARQHHSYLQRQLQLVEEFVHRYLVDDTQRADKMANDVSLKI